MRYYALLIALAAMAACDTPAEPTVGNPVTPARDIVHNGTPYPQLDAQLARLYNFNNCLTGIGPGYLPGPACGTMDMTYEVATISNVQLAGVFPAGVVVDGAASRAALGNYLSIIESAYAIGRVSCRARYALRKIGSAIDTLLIDLIAGQPLDYSSLPQPLTANIVSTAPFTGANDNGVPCADSPAAALAPAGGYSLFATNQSCVDNGRSIELAGNRGFASQSVHSNAGLRISGSENELAGNTTYRCAQSVAADNYLDSGPTQTALRAPPFTYTAASFPCTYSRNGNFNLNGNGAWWVGGNSNSRRLNPGTYCATGNITLSVPLVTGTVTFSAGGTITISGVAPTLRAFANNVVLYSRSTSASAIRLTQAAHSYVGHIYAPSGRVDIASANAAINGTIVAQRVRIAADDVLVYAAGAAN